MANVSLEIIDILRKTASSIGSSADYQWGHMGSCNCGYLAQQVTHLSKDDIHRKAMQSYGDWSEQLHDYCPASGLPLDDLISEMLNFGFDSDDLKHLERLSDPEILKFLPKENRRPLFNSKQDVVHYLNAWAYKVELELIAMIKLPDLRIDRVLAEHL
jgi:hypothetical protein